MTVLHGDCREQLATLEDGSVDAIVTDPPYELGLMGKRWDASGIAYDPIVWAECYRVLKPGGHVLAFGGTRTYHRMACAIEDAGFEIRDSIHWLYGSGFPKSLDVSKAIDKAAGHWRGRAGDAVSGNVAMCGPNYERMDKGDPVTAAAAAAEGWGTALKPAHEPIVVARKPLVGTVAANVLAHGTGALNINGTRIRATPGDEPLKWETPRGGIWSTDATATATATAAGRWPANLVLTHSPECQQTGTRKVRTGTAVNRNRTERKPSAVPIASPTVIPVDVTHADADGTETVPAYECVPGCPVAVLNEQSAHLHAAGTRSKRPDRGPFSNGSKPLEPSLAYKDSGGASRFFAAFEWDPIADVPPFRYVAKPSKKERNAGTENLPQRQTLVGASGHKINPMTGREVVDVPRGNTHPTVKPVALMRWLVRLITPPGGTVLDPFLGSGTTAVAAILEGFEWIGCELTDDYLPIIEARTTWAQQHKPEPDLTLFNNAE